MESIKIIDIRKPNLAAVKRGEVGQELIVVFSVNGVKFRMTYIQEHYFYCGMPGECREHLSLRRYRTERCSALLIVMESLRFLIRIETRKVITYP